MSIKRAQKPDRPIGEIAGWLAAHHGAEIRALQPISGGFWSAAYTYATGSGEWVLRLSDLAEGFAIDRAAMQFAGEHLPIPEVVGVGEALDTHYAISRRHHGRVIETCPAEAADAVSAAFASLLAALRAVPNQPADSVVWYDPRDASTWRGWVAAALAETPEAVASGWQARLETMPALKRLFDACVTRVRDLLPRCPERRDLVHGDLLHQNVLVARDDPATVTGVFSWKCSARGDFLYDVAWCTLWSRWHLPVRAADIWRRTLDADDLTEEDLADAALRHHCYELQIAASHIGWYLWTEDDANLDLLVEVAGGILDRGPLPASRRSRPLG